MSRKAKIIVWCVAVVVLIGALLYMFRVTGSEVVVYSLEQMNPEQLNNETIFKDKQTIRAFTYAVRFANKQPGVAKMAPPAYKFVLDYEEYYLWLLPKQSFGEIAKVGESGTVYKLTKTSAASLQRILRLE
ncbi:MAG: hypothetical protein K0Q94_3827 [Paenibacillus sp.]|jgi:hypothetical protein|nr:hypothetical protein [Paenibacillus sp.]